MGVSAKSAQIACRCRARVARYEHGISDVSDLGWDSWATWMEAHPSLLFWGAIFSFLTVILPLTIGPVVLSRLPADYFGPHRDAERAVSRHPYLRFALSLVRNVLGAALVLFGLVLTVLPGQGIITVLAGLTLMDFRAKRRWIRRVLRRRPVRTSVDWMRRKMGSEPFLIEEEPHSAV